RGAYVRALRISTSQQTGPGPSEYVLPGTSSVPFPDCTQNKCAPGFSSASCRSGSSSATEPTESKCQSRRRARGVGSTIYKWAKEFGIVSSRNYEFFSENSTRGNPKVGGPGNRVAHRG